MLGLGEREDELMMALADLRAAGCDILTLGQYLQPTLRHLPVLEFVTPQKFDDYGRQALDLGFVHVASGPMVRSSYHADEFRLPLAAPRQSKTTNEPIAAEPSRAATKSEPMVVLNRCGLAVE